MPRGTARHEAESIESGELAILQSEFGDPNVRSLQVCALANRVLDGLRLLEDLLEHEVGIPRLLRRLTVPIDRVRRSPKGSSVQRARDNVVGSQDGELSVVEDEDLPRLPEKSRDV